MFESSESALRSKLPRQPVLVCLGSNRAPRGFLRSLIPIANSRPTRQPSHQLSLPIFISTRWMPTNASSIEGDPNDPPSQTAYLPSAEPELATRDLPKR